MRTELLDAVASQVNGMLFFDDWNCNRSSPRFGQRRAWREIVDRYHVAYSDGGDYALLGHRFIVHFET